MGKLIAIVGSTGAGKTSLTHALCSAGNYLTGLEGHRERPFQALFKADPRYALANQVDYLLLRAEQEQAIRLAVRTGIVDGGLEMDFHGFTRLFRARGRLGEAEFDLCRRLYEFVRSMLPPPDLVIHMSAPPEVIAARLARRERINIASAEDMPLLETFLGEWLAGLDPARVVRVDATPDDPNYRQILPALLNKIADPGPVLK
jgi:deoxyadenosine/deoxycytidine kinase